LLFVIKLFFSAGRLDDVIVLATGEKTVAAPIEDRIAASRLVDWAVMFGRSRNQVGVLIEPKVFPKDEKSFIDNVWTDIEAANELAPTFGRIFKNMILLTRPEKRMKKADKGSVMKKATIAQFEKEIQELCVAFSISVSGTRFD
jgi:long-subunit acyl-CoA synthetase (AMP-forming)